MMPENQITRCRFCKAVFTPRSSGGSKQEFCSAAHRKLYNKYGGAVFQREANRIRREVLAAIRAEVPAMIERQLRQLRIIR